MKAEWQGRIASADEPEADAAPRLARLVVREPAAAGQGAGAIETEPEVDEAARQRREEMVRAGLYDALTELPNRARFLERLRQATAGADWCREGLFVLLLDIDAFGEVNARLGFEVVLWKSGQGPELAS